MCDDLQRMSWCVAGIVIAINGYVLVDFFLSQVQGFIYGILVCFVAASYTAFLVYLILRSTTLPRFHGFNFLHWNFKIRIICNGTSCAVNLNVYRFRSVIFNFESVVFNCKFITTKEGVIRDEIRSYHTLSALNLFMSHQYLKILLSWVEVKMRKI